MSEYEKQQRTAYRKRRNTFLSLLLAVTVIISAALIICGAGYIKAGRDSFISYTEKGNAVYKAYLADNDFYSEEYLNGSHAYVASLIEKMTADFSYDIKMEAEEVSFKYNYDISAQLVIKDKESNKAIYNPVYVLKDSASDECKDNKLSIKDSVEIDYNKFNNQAKAFIAAYRLKDTEEQLIVKMNINLVGENEKFAECENNCYSIELYVPLNSTTVTPYVSTPAENDSKILVVNHNNHSTFKMFTVIFAICELIIVPITLLFAIFTKDKHIDYARKVKRLRASYKSYIQKINTPFDMAGYQILNVDTFTQMLEIRDTVLRPILMYENEDKTSTDFFIADQSIVYLYRISVSDDYTPNAISSFISKGRKEEAIVYSTNEE